MKLLILNENRIIKFELPNVVDGNEWLTIQDETDKELKVVNIVAKDGKWQILSNNDFYLEVDGEKVSNLELIENSFYQVKGVNRVINLLIYCEFSEIDYSFYSISTNLKTGVTIGSNDNSIIKYKNPLIMDNHVTIIEKDNYYFINCNGLTYVNNIRYVESNLLNYGDIIFIMGLRLFILKTPTDVIIGVNSKNINVSTLLKEINLDRTSFNKYDEANEEKDINLYESEDYFYKKPRFIYSVRTANIVIDSPPEKKDSEELPAILTYGPMLTMSLTSFVTVFSTINNIQSGQTSLKDSAPSLIMSGAMLLSFLLWPFITNKFQKRMEKKKEQKRQKKYSEYIENQRNLILKEKANQEVIMKDSFVSLSECEQIILNKKTRLWEKRVENPDFWSVSLGYGNIKMDIDIQYPENRFTLLEDNLVDTVNNLRNVEKILENVPISYSFLENTVTAIISDNQLKYKLAKNIIYQFVTFNSYDNFKIVILTSKNKEYLWNDFKILPHIFNYEKSFRFFGTTQDDYKEIIYVLDKVFSQRKELLANTSEPSTYLENYLIITDSFNSLRTNDFIINLMENKTNLGFSFLILNDRISNLPDQTQTFIELKMNECKIFKNIANSDQQLFSLDNTNINFYRSFEALSNIPIESNLKMESMIPKKVGFLEMYEVGRIEQLNVRNRWNDNVPIQNMGALVGIGANEEKISLDLHEKFHGPHGLVAGMTGSGKSEFIITYILSMAVNYHPYEVQFILIDYKGGGLTGAFENQNLGYKLPHLVGVITNLEKNEINRSLASIESELKRRQALFNKAREISGESTVDIYKYQKMYRSKIVDEPVSHLFIVADEFAELKTQQPEFMDQLISTARIGRSLGVHLILATQKPSGVVDSQIWSNTRFRVCLRVQEKGDSSEVIQRPDAAYLTQTGRFYLQVGFNEIFLQGQSAWAGGAYHPSDVIKKKIDTSINIIDNIGYITNTINTKVEEKQDDSNGEELNNIVKHLSDLAKENNLVARPLWLAKIPAFITINNLITKYNYQKEQFIFNPVIGEYDVPNKQEQHLLTVPFTEEGNVVLYGMAGSGKETFITSLICSSMMYYSPKEVNYYILDFGSEVLRYFSNSPLVGDILYISDEEKIENLFKKIQEEITERKKIFSEYNGSFIDYLKKSGNIIPNIVIIINNYESYSETYPDYDELLIILTRDCSKYGIYFVVTSNTPNGLRYKLTQNFRQIFVLQQTDEDDYSTIIGNTNKLYPAKIIGRGLIKKEEVYEFQTAWISEAENVSDTVEAMNNKVFETYNMRVEKVPILPEVVIYDSINDNNGGIILGVDKNTLKISRFDYKNKFINLLTGKSISNIEYFINPFLYQMANDSTSLTLVIDAENQSIEEDIKEKINYYNDDFDRIYDILLNTFDNIKQQYEQTKQLENIKRINCVIIGLKSFIESLSDDKKREISRLFEDKLITRVVNYIFIDNIDKINEFLYEDWFKGNYSAQDAIWFGDGIRDQFSININNKVPEMSSEVPYNFCFVINNGKASFVKYIEQIHE